MQVKMKKVHPDARVPTYATDGSACFDLYAVDVPSWSTPVHHGIPVVIRTGLEFEIPAGNVMLLFGRSGHGFTFDTRLGNCVGVIDADYRGEVMVKLTRDNGMTSVLSIKNGDRIAQAMVLPFERATFAMVDELAQTERGQGGFGSTGA